MVKLWCSTYSLTQEHPTEIHVTNKAIATIISSASYIPDTPSCTIDSVVCLEHCSTTPFDLKIKCVTS